MWIVYKAGTINWIFSKLNILFVAVLKNFFEVFLSDYIDHPEVDAVRQGEKSIKKMPLSQTPGKFNKNRLAIVFGN